MPRRQYFLLALLACTVACVTYLAYKPGLHGPFVFDDLSNILLVKTTYLRELSFSALYNTAMAVDSGPLHRPIAILSFALNYFFTRIDVYYFKLTNLTIHLITGFLLYRLTYRLLNRHTQTNTNEEYSSLKLNLLALGVAGVWILHPLNLTSVLYVVQRMTSLASMFTVLGVLGYVVGREQILRGQRRGFATALASVTVFGALAALSKEIGILLPVYVLLIEIFFYRMSAPENLRRSFNWVFYSIIVAPLVLGVGIALAKSGTLLALDAYQTRNFTLGERLLTESRVMWFYLKLIVMPTIGELGTYHDDIAISTNLFNPITTLFSTIGLAGLLGISLISYRRAPMLGFGLAWFLLGHSLESTVVPLEIAHEHRNYLPQVGILLGAIYYTSHSSKVHLSTQNIRYLAILCYIVLMGVITHARAAEWKDEWTLFNAEARNHPNSVRSHTALAVLYNDNKKYPEAEEHFRRAAELQPSEVETMARLAQFELARKGHIPEPVLADLDFRISNYNFTPVAIAQFVDLLRDAKKDPETHKKVLELFEKLTRKYEGRLEVKWQLVAYHMLAINYDELDQHREAIAYYMLSAKLDPKAYYYIRTAIHYAILGDASMADRMIISVADKHLVLNDTDIGLLTELKELLKQRQRHGTSKKGIAYEQP